MKRKRESRILPKSARDFLDDLRSREKSLSKMLDNISDTCFSGKATLDEITAECDAFFDLLETIEMDIEGMIRIMNLTKERIAFFIKLLNPLLALFAGSIEGDTIRANKIIDLAIGRYGVRYNSFFEEEEDAY